jgi:hypothetical protein
MSGLVLAFSLPASVKRLGNYSFQELGAWKQKFPTLRFQSRHPRDVAEFIIGRRSRDPAAHPSYACFAGFSARAVFHRLWIRKSNLD